MHIQQVEVELPEAKPAWEWVRGRALQKMSPRFVHARLQGAWYRALDDWSGAPPGEVRRPLVPDVAYLNAATFGALRDRDRDYPPVAPDIVVEILSPGDRAADVDAKRCDYLAAGSALVVIVDPVTRTVQAFETGNRERRFTADETLVAEAFPDLAVGLRVIFASIAFPG